MATTSMMFAAVLTSGCLPEGSGAVAVPTSSTTTTVTAPSTTAPVSTTTTTTTVAPPTTTTIPAPGGSGAVTSWRLARTPSTYNGCELYPRDHVWHSVTTGLPVHPKSDAWIREIRSIAPNLRVGLGGTVWDGSRAGIPITPTDSRTVPGVNVLFSFDWLWMSNTSAYHIPSNYRIEGDPTPAWDRHLLLVDKADCVLSELIQAAPPSQSLLGVWGAMAGVKLDLESYAMEKATTDAANLAVAPGLIRYDEVQAGSIDHIIRFCLPNSKAKEYVWPATGSDGPNPSADAPPMGARFRLKAAVDTSTWSREARVIAEGMRTHGLILADTCPGFTISGESDARWNDAALKDLTRLTPADFEGVDVTPMIISPTSRQVR